jgi:hypothetical protein
MIPPALPGLSQKTKQCQEQLRLQAEMLDVINQLLSPISQSAQSHNTIKQDSHRQEIGHGAIFHLAVALKAHARRKGICHNFPCLRQS